MSFGVRMKSVCRGGCFGELEGAFEQYYDEKKSFLFQGKSDTDRVRVSQKK